ncbi:MAG: AMP-binding protein [Nitriliruptoraceae bacterium]
MTRRLVALHVPNEAFGAHLRRVWETGDAVLPLPWSSSQIPAAARPAQDLVSALWPDDLVDETGVLDLCRDGDGPDADGPASHKRLVSDCALVVTTSGSTGAPKGVMLTHAALAASTRASVEYLAAAHGDRFALALPLHHVAGIQVLLRSWRSGTEPEYLPADDPAAITASQATHISLVPTQAEQVLARQPEWLPWTTILLGGGPASAQTIVGLHAAGPRVVTSYGMTETCGGCVYDGVPIGQAKVRIERNGRIAIAGPMMFSGYLDSGQGSSPGSCNGWFTSNDLGELDDQGRLRVHGRADDIIVSGGENIPASPIAQAVRSYPGVTDAAVIGVPDRRWGYAIVAFVVSNREIDPDALLTHVRAALPRGHSPKRLLFVDAIPTTGLGKPDRQALETLATSRH